MQGVVNLTRGMRIGYLPQQAKFQSDRTLREECLTVFAEMINTQKILHQLEHQMAADEGPSKELVESYGKLQSEFEFAGGYSFEIRIQQTLMAWVFTCRYGPAIAATFWGAKNTGAAGETATWRNPIYCYWMNLPTIWISTQLNGLKSFLKDWKGAVLIVSHDRYFLDQVVGTIWEMTPDLEDI